MTPEELEELRALVGRLGSTGHDKNLAVVLGAALEHIDQQATALDEAEALTKKNVELMNGYLARIAELEAQVAVLQKIAVHSHAMYLHERQSGLDWYECSTDHRDEMFDESRRQLSEEHPEAFR